MIYGKDGSGIDQIDNNLGIKVDGIYTINEDVRAGAGFGFYFPHEQNGVKQTVWKLNFNGNYLFFSEDKLILYGLAGINITGISFDYSNQTGGGLAFSGSNSEIGLNIGGGLEYGLDFAGLFTELKYDISNYDQLAIGAGLRFDI